MRVVHLDWLAHAHFTSGCICTIWVRRRVLVISFAVTSGTLVGIGQCVTDLHELVHVLSVIRHVVQQQRTCVTWRTPAHALSVTYGHVKFNDKDTEFDIESVLRNG